VNVNLDGSTTVTNYSTETSVQSASSSVPEPGSLPLLGTVVALMGALLVKNDTRAKAKNCCLSTGTTMEALGKANTKLAR